MSLLPRFNTSPILWAADGRHYIREITSEDQAQAAAIALQNGNDLASFYALHQGGFEADRPQYRGFVVHDPDGSIDGAILVERDGFCWRPLGTTWPKKRKRPTKGLKKAVQALCAQEGVCGVRPSQTGHVNRSTLGQLNCTTKTRYCQPDGSGALVPMGRPGVTKTARPSLSDRQGMPAELFALPAESIPASRRSRLRGARGAYPMDTMARARNARSRAISQLNAGRLTVFQAQTILDRTARFTAQMEARGLRGWNALAPARIQGTKGRYQLVHVQALRGAANCTGHANCGCDGHRNMILSRRRDGRFLPRRRAAPGLLSYDGSGGPILSRKKNGQFVSERRAAPALGHGNRHRKGRVWSAGPAAPMEANVLPSRRRNGQFVSTQIAAPGLRDYDGSGGPILSRNGKGQFVSERQAAPALGHGNVQASGKPPKHFWSLMTKRLQAARGWKIQLERGSSALSDEELSDLIRTNVREAKAFYTAYREAGGTKPPPIKG